MIWKQVSIWKYTQTFLTWENAPIADFAISLIWQYPLDFYMDYHLRCYRGAIRLMIPYGATF